MFLFSNSPGRSSMPLSLGEAVEWGGSIYILIFPSGWWQWFSNNYLLSPIFMFWLRELHCGSFQSDWLVYFSSVTCHPQKILKIKESDNLGREKNVMKMNFQSIFQATRLMDKQQPFQKVSWAKPVVFMRHARQKQKWLLEKNQLYWINFYPQHKEMRWHQNLLQAINIFIINRKWWKPHLFTDISGNFNVLTDKDVLFKSIFNIFTALSSE